MDIDPEMPLYPIGSVARLLGCSAKVLRDYERNALIAPARSTGQHRLYSLKDIEIISLIHYLAQHRKINLAGIKLLMDLWPALSEPARKKLLKASESSRQSGLTPADIQTETPDSSSPA
jgi:DNA-binding transcriptional MerR regulator